MNDIFDSHKKRYPEMDIRDYVKLIHQSVFGPKHASREPSHDQVAIYLDEELVSFRMHPDTPWYEPIGNGFVRVSLDVIIDGGVAKERLCEAFLKSMNIPMEDADTLKKTIEDAIRDLLEWMRSWTDEKTYQESHEFVIWYRKEGYPAIHHSEFYRLNYHPHYRVIHKDFIPILKGEIDS